MAAALAIAVFALALAYGPRDGGTGPAAPPSPTARTPAGFRAVFVPASPSSRESLEQTASTMTARLRAFGVNGASVSVVGGSVVVSGERVPQADLRLLGTAATFLVRPVECGAPASGPAPAGAAAPAPDAAPPACAAPYLITPSSLGLTPGSGAGPGSTSNTVPPDPAFTSYPSTPAADDDPSIRVLLPADPESGTQQYSRYVLGPAELDGSGIASVHAEQAGGSSEWLLDITLSPSASAQWDTVAEQNFHGLVGIDLDGQVLSASVIEPTQATFSSFAGHIEVPGNFSASEAAGLAGLLESGPMPVRLSLQSETYVSPALGSTTSTTSTTSTPSTTSTTSATSTT